MLKIETLSVKNVFCSFFISLTPLLITLLECVTYINRIIALAACTGDIEVGESCIVFNITT